MTTILCGIFFLSGASALIFEALWFQLSGLTFGNSVWATSIVLSSFMGGLALGNGLAAFFGHKVQSPIRVYAYIEIVIAITGIGLVLVFPVLTKLFAPVFHVFLGHPFVLNSLRAVIAFFLMFVSATAMGATLPILIKALYAERPNFGRILGILYGWNTLGAVAGVIICELFLIKWFGIRGTGLVAAGFNIIAAIAAAWLSRKHTGESATILRREEPSVFSRFSRDMTRILLASFLSGMTLLALEVVWFRFLLLFFNPHSWNFAVMLAVVLSGISLGGLFASRWFKLRSDAHVFLLPVLMLNGILIILLYSNFGHILNISENFNNDMKILFVSLFLMFPVSFVSGTVFIMLGNALNELLVAETKTAGLLTLANTTGAMSGALISGLILIPCMGIEKSFFLFALLYGITAILLVHTKQFALSERKLSVHNTSGAALLIALIIFPFGLMNRDFLDVACAHYIEKAGEKRVAAKEGLTETIQYLQKDLLGEPYYHRLVTNNYSMSGTLRTGRRYMKLFAYWPIALHPDPKSALLICYGCGSTAKALTDTKCLRNIDIVDISRDIVEMGKIVYPDPEENPANDPRVKIHIEDGRFFLLTTKHKFDLITGEPPPPLFSGIVNLYTEEYFQLIHDRLSEGGIVAYWLPVYQLKSSEAKSILKGFCNVFKDSSLWTGAGFEWMMVGIKNPQKPVSEQAFRRQWDDPVVGTEMRALGFENPEQFGSLFIADGRRLRDWISDALPLTDNYPKRLSYGDHEWRQYLPVYREFMSNDASRTDFMESEGIAKIWPDSLRRKTDKYFAIRQTINEMLGEREMREINPLVNLHRCIHNPLLKNYVLWAFGSDQHAQGIINRTLKAEPEKLFDLSDTYEHLAARAAQQQDYLLAEQYLHLSVDRLGRHSSKSYAVFRMYLLFIAGEKNQALAVGRQYINHKEDGRDLRTKQMATYWKWMVKMLEGGKQESVGSG